MPHGGSTGTAPWTPCPDTNRIVHDSTWTSKLHWSKARARVFPPTKLLRCGRPTLVNGNSSLSPSSPLHRQGRQGWQQQPFETAVKWSHSSPFKTLPWILISLREVKLRTMVSKAPNQESANVGGPLPVSINKVLLAHRQLASVLAMAASGLRATRPKTLTPGPSRSQPAHPDSQRSASHPRPSAGISFHSLPHSAPAPATSLLFQGYQASWPLEALPTWLSAAGNCKACSSNSGRTCPNQTSLQMATLPSLKKTPHIHTSPPPIIFLHITNHLIWFTIFFFCLIWPLHIRILASWGQRFFCRFCSLSQCLQQCLAYRSNPIKIC